MAAGASVCGTSREGDATGGLTTTVLDGCTTATAGRVAAAPAGALATTGPTGGRDAIAGVAGGTIEGAGRGCGTTLRGSGLAGAATAGLAEATGGAGFAGAFRGGGTVRAGAWLRRASSSSSCFLARIAFITSPTLVTWDKSIFGAIACAAREAAVPWAAEWAAC